MILRHPPGGAIYITWLGTPCHDHTGRDAFVLWMHNAIAHRVTDPTAEQAVFAVWGTPPG